MRWWYELKTPSLKCERLGHDMHPVVKRGYCLPNEVRGAAGILGMINGAVAFRVVVTFNVCRRCKFEINEDRKIEVVTAIHSLSMPSEDWDVLRDKGFLLNQ